MQSKILTALGPAALLVAGLISSLTCRATDYALTVTDIHGHTADFPVDARLRLQVQNDNIRIESAEGTALFEIGDISKLTYHIADPGAVGVINLPPAVRVSGSTLHISTSTGNNSSFTLCDLSGACVAEGSVDSELSLDLTSLPGGIYIFKLENSPVVKFTLK